MPSKKDLAVALRRHGVPTKLIGETLGWKSSTVKSLLHDARLSDPTIPTEKASDGRSNLCIEIHAETARSLAAATKARRRTGTPISIASLAERLVNQAAASNLIDAILDDRK